jgi:hypothetical protein
VRHIAFLSYLTSFLSFDPAQDRILWFNSTSRHENIVFAHIKKRDSYVALKIKTEQLKLDTLQFMIPEPSPCIQSKIEFNHPAAVLRDLVFPYLDYKDVVKPVCKLWTQLAECNVLWKTLYQNQFGCSPLPLSPIVSLHWKTLFCSTLLAQNSIRGQRNNLGWQIRICPTVGCNKQLRSQFEFDLHLLKHEQRCYLDLIKLKNRLRRDQKRTSLP